MRLVPPAETAASTAAWTVVCVPPLGATVNRGVKVATSPTPAVGSQSSVVSAGSVPARARYLRIVDSAACSLVSCGREGVPPRGPITPASGRRLELSVVPVWPPPVEAPPMPAVPVELAPFPPTPAGPGAAASFPVQPITACRATAIPAASHLAGRFTDSRLGQSSRRGKRKCATPPKEV